MTGSARLDTITFADIVRAALLEDLRDGDATTAACVQDGVVLNASLVAREPIVVCGLPVVKEVFAQLDTDVSFEPLVADGDAVTGGDRLARLVGDAKAVLAGERVALNFLQHLSGIATTVAEYKSQLPAGSATRITETRKTTPGLRVLERYAVRCGGGYNHRANLGAAIMIKDNHVAAAGGVVAAIASVRASRGHTMTVSCEVDRLDQVLPALEAGIDILVLDNFTPEQVVQAMTQVAGRALVEVTGGVRLDTVVDYASAGVDILSIGALTQRSPAVDIGLDVE